MLGRILRLPVIFERVHVQNGLLLSKMVQNDHCYPSKMKFTCQNDGHVNFNVAKLNTLLKVLFC